MSYTKFTDEAPAVKQAVSVREYEKNNLVIGNTTDYNVEYSWWSTWYSKSRS